MSDITIPGVNDKLGTQNIIASLVKVERNKLDQMQGQKKEYQELKAIWQDENKREMAVRDAAKVLYGYNSPFGSKLGSSADEKSLTVSATRAASNGEYAVKVLKQATNDRFLSKSIPLDTVLATGEYRFKVGEKELVFNFKGGKVQNFADAVNLKNPSLLKASVIKDQASSQILQIEAVPVGAKNALAFTGTALDELTRIGMLGPQKGFEKDLLTTETQVAPGAKQSWKPDEPLTITAGMELRMTVAFLAGPASPATTPGGFEFPGGGSVTYQGITLTGAGMEGQVPPPPPAAPPTELTTLKGLSLQTGTQSISLPDLPDTTTPTVLTVPLPVGQNFGSLDLVNGNSKRSISISKIEIVDGTKKGGTAPLQPLSQAGDAELEFEGIKIVRDKNSVDDVIPGVTLNLQAPSKDPVKVKVEPDKKAIKDAVIGYLSSYNRLLTDILVLTSMRPDDPASSAVIQEATYLTDDEKKKSEDRLGKFQGDVSLNQMKNAMQRIMMDPYKTDGSSFTLLAQVGISTNSSSAGNDHVNISKLRGYMEMDEPTFDAAVAKDIEGVRKLFGNSLDGTLVVNSGAAYSVDELLKPSTQLGGFNAMRMSSLDGQIKAKDKQMADYNDYLVRYQADLKRKYGQMEANLNAMNKNAQSLNNMGGGQQ